MTPEQKQFIAESKAVLANINRDMHRLESLLKAMEPEPEYDWSAFYENLGCRFKRITETPEN